MSRPADLPRRRTRHPLTGAADPDGHAAPGAADAAPSKTRRKSEMHALQDLGEALVALDAGRLAELAAEAGLPERLVEAVAQARTITAWGGRKRQLQFIGKLMREVDPEPIRRRLDAWAHGHREDAARQHALERWRERLLAEPAALDALAAEHPRLDRPRFRALIAKARDERAQGAPPHAYRELFRELKALASDHPPLPPP
jgi:ribosome-associated protein